MQDSVCYGKNPFLLAIWNELVPPPPTKKNTVLLDMDRYYILCFITFTRRSSASVFVWACHVCFNYLPIVTTFPFKFVFLLSCMFQSLSYFCLYKVNTHCTSPFQQNKISINIWFKLIILCFNEFIEYSTIYFFLDVTFHS